MSGNKSFRIKYDKDNSIDHLKVKINQDFDFLEVLSLKITQEDTYKMYSSNYGVLVGRVLANDGFGVPNAKVSIFIENNDIDETNKEDIIYPYSSVSSKNQDDIRYNLLPSEKVHKCHQNVGTFPPKRTLLDNDEQINVFEKYYKYTTVTNSSGDYMIFGIPVGQQQLHVDIDLSDIGVLSQTPRDMEYKGYNIKQFDSPNKFKKSTNLDSLSQIITENTSVYIYPFWGDENESEIAISKKNINLQYKFEPTCVFMGGIFADSEKNGISKTCKPSKTAGKMSEMVASQGSIEMIRKTIDGKIEFYDVNGNRQINSDGVWCYQIPMNLDYVVTDEYGNIKPTDDPNKGIPTRTEVRFRIKMDDNGDEFIQNKTAYYLVPNNPKTVNEEDYAFGSACKDTSFVNLMWNKVYSVKNYTARLQKDRRSFFGGRGTEVKNRRFTGIKSTNYHESNNPMPYNNMYVNITLKFMLLCLLTKLILNAARFLNNVISWIRSKFILIVCAHVCIDTKMLGDCDSISDITERDYYVPVGRYTQNKLMRKTKNSKPAGSTFAYEGKDTFYGRKYYIDRIESCIETSLSSENEVVNFDFTNDWLNGSLYAPRFLVKSKKNRKSGELSTYYCGSDTENDYSGLTLIQTCAASINHYGTQDTNTINECKNKGRCFKKNKKIDVGRGNIIKNEEYYYYRSVEFEHGDKLKDKYIQPTGIILLGSFSDCDQDGIPQLHQELPSTTFKLPPDSVETEEIGGFVLTPFYDSTLKYEVHTYDDYDELLNNRTDDDFTMNDGVIYYTVDGAQYYYYDGDFHVTSDYFISGSTSAGWTGTTESEFNDMVNQYILDDSSNITFSQERFLTTGTMSFKDIWTAPSGSSSQTVPEISGIDWGNKADNYDNKIHFENGLFVGVNCVDSDTYTKSCVNVYRLCELGVDFDEKQQYSDGLITGSIDVDGFIGVDEISDGDARAMFATLNVNDLKVKNVNGEIKYDFNYLYPDGFDGKLRSSMTSVNADTISYDYLKFRFGSRYNDYDLKNMYYTYEDNNNRFSFPKYENSFYFYFGLKPGKTSLDLFNSQYFVQCSETKQAQFNIFLSIVEQEGLCQGNDGVMKIEISDILFPCTIYLNNQKYVSDGIDNEYLIDGLSSQYYLVSVSDANKQTVSSNIFLPRNEGITFNCTSTNSSSITSPNGKINISGVTNGNSNLNEYSYYLTGTTRSGNNINPISGNFNGEQYIINNIRGGYYTVKIYEKDCPNNSSINSFISIYEPPTLTMSGVTYTNDANSIRLENIRVINDGGGYNDEYGVYYKQTDDDYYLPTTGDTKVTGTTSSVTKFGITISSLLPGKKYVFRAYGINSYGESLSQNTKVAMTKPDVPSLDTSAVINITGTSATVGGENILDNGSQIIEQGAILSPMSSTVNLWPSDFAFDGMTTGGSGQKIYEVYYNSEGGITAGPHESEYIIPTGLTDPIRFDLSYKFNMYVIVDNSVTNNTAPVWVNLDLFMYSMSFNHPFYNGYSSDEIKLFFGDTYPPSSLWVYFANGNSNTGIIVNEYKSITPAIFEFNLTKENVTYITGQPIKFSSVHTEWIGKTLCSSYPEIIVVDINLIAVGYGSDMPIIIGKTYQDDDEIGNNSFTINATGLTANNNYEVMSYAKNNEGIGYGEKINFTTLSE